MTRKRRARAVGAPEDPEEPMSERRLFVGKPQQVELEGGGTMSYRAGEFYMVPDELADRWLAEDIAYDPEDPPTCPVCGVEVTDYVQEADTIVGPRTLLERHLVGKHPESVPDAAEPGKE